MTVHQLVGDCREQLRTLPADSVHACITSPPYYGLRDYGTNPQVWGGDQEHTHEWGSLIVGPKTTVFQGDGTAKIDSADFSRFVGDRKSIRPAHGSICGCGAWRGSLGLEPTPELFIEHLVGVFREVRRVLRPDGTLWVNMGDSYAGSGNGAHDYRERNKNRSLSLHPDKYVGQSTRALQRVGPQEHTEGHGRVAGYKPKDLMLMPARVALALQADGWYLRSQIPWLKRNAMPESVTDRPASAVEYVYLLSKSGRYYWDAEAVQVASSSDHGSGNGYARRRQLSRNGRGQSEGWKMQPNRNRRNSDWFLESWQGLMLDENDDPLALVVNPQPFKGSHFATFPPKLVEPMVKASTRPGDTVLDCFGGAGTVGLVADRLGRNAVLIDLKPDYAAMAHSRITDDAPLFTEVVA